jgi:uncharacterized membrane protein YccF (DUF307 family)
LFFLIGGVVGVLAWRLAGDISFAFTGLLLAMIAALSIGNAARRPISGGPIP